MQGVYCRDANKTGAIQQLTCKVQLLIPPGLRNGLFLLPENNGLPSLLGAVAETTARPAHASAGTSHLRYGLACCFVERDQVDFWNLRKADACCKSIDDQNANAQVQWILWGAAILHDHN